jgi:hypothetical protein
MKNSQIILLLMAVMLVFMSSCMKTYECKDVNGSVIGQVKGFTEKQATKDLNCQSNCNCYLVK